MVEKVDPWDTRFGFFWYNDQEIFRSSDADLSRRAKDLADAGINHVITFSCTHFRWSFRQYWDSLTEVLARIVGACHEHNIAVTEHHSSHLTFNPLDDTGERYLDRVLSVRGSSRSTWPKLREDCDADPLIDDERLSSFRQIDGSTGTWARSTYQGWCMCFNNPAFRSAYLHYLETLYEVGIDGIMTDDVQYFGLDERSGRWNACACVHCRSLFRERTGYELPPPGAAWDRWHSDCAQPSFIAWLQFRQDSTWDFHRAVKTHYESLGLRLARPNYCSDVLNRNPSAYSLETLPALDWVFKENCFSSIIRYSWPSWAVEAAHRYAVGRRRSIPPMSMFYPDREDTMRFSWALAMSWGHLYLATPEGASLNEEEKALRSFERDHARLLHRTRNTSALGFYDSMRNRLLSQHAETRSLPQMKGWIQACYRAHLPFDLFQHDELIAGPQHDVIVFNETTIMSDEELNAARDFADTGGTVLWTGSSGALQPSGIARPQSFMKQLWGAGVVPANDGDPPRSYQIGNGRLIVVGGDAGPRLPEPVVRSDRWQEHEIRVDYASIVPDELQKRAELVQWLRSLIADARDGHGRGCTMQVVDAPRDLTVTVLETESGTTVVLHVVNTGGTLTPGEDGKVGHSDPVRFPPLSAGKNIGILLRLPDSFRGGVVSEVTLHRPGSDSKAIGRWTQERNVVHIEINPAEIEFYALVEVATVSAPA